MIKSEDQKIKTYIDLINFCSSFLLVVPMLFILNFVNNSFEKSELLNEQFENFNELKALYNELKKSNTKSNDLTIQNMNNDKLDIEMSLEIRQEVANKIHKSNSPKYDLIKLILIGLTTAI